ncbi:class I adenylate-forming enzyme family protein [Zhengella sp. ZM62]|uniref:class I adenylate-forming enzyme family protein n=1 Tax=Zhengella sedimenti TaxID=3390035 RepID=UPI003975F211
MKPDWYQDSLTTWPEVLDRQAKTQGERTFLVMDDRTVSYAAFRNEADRVARGLLALGVSKGDVVALYMTNSIEWVICQFAIYKAGAILLPLYSYYRESELGYALEQSGASALIMQDRFLGKVDACAIARTSIPELDTAPADAFSSAKFPSLQNIVRVGSGEDLPSRHTLETVIERGDAIPPAALAARQAEITPFDVMNIMYTSGTTGFPKGGMSMHVTNLVTTHQWSRLAGLGQDDVILCHVPLFTNFGGLYGAPLGMRNGAKVVITEQFDAGRSLELIETHAVTYIPGTPSMFRMLLDHPDIATRNLSSVRGGHVAGAPLTDATMQDILDVLGAERIMQAWGLSECGGLSTVTTADDPREKRLSTVGKPLASAVLRIVDDQGREVEQGAQGEILLGDALPGSCVGKGYWKMPEKTAQTIDEQGFFHTGDVGFLDVDGYLHITGRVDDMFTVGGFNIYPAEIEKRLEEMAGVREAHVIPVADRRMGNLPAAWIVPDPGNPPTAEAVARHVRTLMTSQKVPRRVFFCAAEDLPRTPVGKLKKKDLLRMTAEKVAIDPDAGLVRSEERTK